LLDLDSFHGMEACGRMLRILRELRPSRAPPRSLKNKATRGVPCHIQQPGPDSQLRRVVVGDGDALIVIQTLWEAAANVGQRGTEVVQCFRNVLGTE
jgi:hypothetical protein